jgi:hypothetical protein
MYRTVPQIDWMIDLLSATRPDIFTKFTLNEPSIEGRAVNGIRLHAGPSTSRNAVLILGGTHARELMNPDAIIDLAVDLFLSYDNGTDLKYGNRTWPIGDVRIFMEALDIWLVPCTNPDGRQHVLTTDDMWRKNRRVNPAAARPICHGVDLNRNADFMWGVTMGNTSCNECTIVYCGPTAFSEPETRNIRHLLETQDFVTFLDVHSYSELVLYPWGHAPTQSTDQTKRFMGLQTGTCTASVPGGYAEYMPARDVQRFTTVSRKIVQDIKAVRNRQYTAKAIQGLYPCTGTLSDFAYSRHIKTPGNAKTYGFSYETGPIIYDSTLPGGVDEPKSFHPDDPKPIYKEIKAGIVSLLQQSVCAIQLIGSSLFSSGKPLAAFRRFRDEVLSTRPPGREWIALYERTQFGLLSVVMRKPRLFAEASALLKASSEWIKDENSKIPDVDIERALGLVNRLMAVTKDKDLRRDLAAVAVQVKAARGRTVRAAFEALLRHGPGERPASSGKKNPVKKRGATKTKPAVKRKK